MISLIDLKKKVFEIAKEIDAPISEVLTFGISRDDGTPCVQIEREAYYYLARDRNTVTFQKQTYDIDELAFWIFSDVTFDMAVRYEVKNRKKNIDPRRTIFSYQLKLLEKINSEWVKKQREEIDEILINSPYIDFSKEE